MNRVHDALIIGGGPAGGTAALLLARAGWSVALLERSDFPRRKVCGEYLSATNLPLFDQLGVGSLFREEAGPPVEKVGLFAGRTILQTALPRPSNSGVEYGRALSRERLDLMLVQQAANAGAEIRQPWSVLGIEKDGDLYRVQAKSMDDGHTEELSAKVVIAAHGSWNPGTLPTQPPRRPHHPSDLLGFKAHFQNSDLPLGLMPLLAFPGGYGGMVHCESGRTSLSLCIRRDQLTALRQQMPGEAGEAVLAHVKSSCLGVQRALENAPRDGEWLSAGPIHPGVRIRELGGIFLVGNAAGEAHPAIAEGISMAMQSAWLVANRLVDWRRDGAKVASLPTLGRAYAADWRQHFAPRLSASHLIAKWAMSPVAVASLVPVFRCFPSTMGWFARLSGKATSVVKRTRAAALAD